jgi:hypothetical protein
LVENFVIIKKVLLEFRNLWRWYFTGSIVTVDVVEIEKLLREPFSIIVRIVVELASLCKIIASSKCVSIKGSINNRQGIVSGFPD